MSLFLSIRFRGSRRAWTSFGYFNEWGYYALTGLCGTLQGRSLCVGLRFGWPLVLKGFCFFRGLNVYGRGRHSDFEWGY